MCFKRKIISFFTAFTIALTAVSGSLVYAESSVFNPLGIAMTADKTWFTPEEINEGQTVTVYVDPVGEVLESDHVGSLQFNIVSDAWGCLDPVDVILCNDNALATDKGNNLKKDKPFNQFASMTGSKWDSEAIPKKAGYIIFDYNTFSDFDGYADGLYVPTVTILSDSSNGFFRSAGSEEDKHIVQFKLDLPKDLPLGSYTLSFKDAKSMICPDGEYGSLDSVNIESPIAEGITFTVAEEKPVETTKVTNSITRPTTTQRPTGGDSLTNTDIQTEISTTAAKTITTVPNIE